MRLSVSVGFVGEILFLITNTMKILMDDFACNTRCAGPVIKMEAACLFNNRVAQLFLQQTNIGSSNSFGKTLHLKRYYLIQQLYFSFLIANT